jgi:type II secretion system protein J
MRARHPVQRHLRQQGFTLLELLVATAVGAVVLLVIQTTFFGALRLSNTTHDKIDEDLVIHRSLGIIRRDLSGIMLPPTPRNDGTLPTGKLAGQLQSTNFSGLNEGNYGDRVTPDLFTNSGKIDGWNPFSEVQMVAYYLAPATGNTPGKDLVRVVTRNLLPVQDADAEPQVILHGVDSATIQYYDRTSWTDMWDSVETKSLPTAFKFSITMAVRDNSQATLAPIELIVPIPVMTTTTQQEIQEEEAPL